MSQKQCECNHLLNNWNPDVDNISYYITTYIDIEMVLKRKDVKSMVICKPLNQ